VTDVHSCPSFDFSFFFFQLPVGGGIIGACNIRKKVDQRVNYFAGDSCHELPLLIHSKKGGGREGERERVRRREAGRKERRKGGREGGRKGGKEGGRERVRENEGKCGRGLCEGEKFEN